LNETQEALLAKLPAVTPRQSPQVATHRSQQRFCRSMKIPNIDDKNE
jgi:hypothetical protein